MFFVFTTIYLLKAITIVPQVDEGLVGPSFLPVVISIIMYAALAVVVFQEVRAGLPARDKQTFNLVEPVLVVVATAAYIALFELIGFVLSTILYVFVLLYIFRLDRKGMGWRIAYTLIITGIGYLLFRVFFDVRLPTLTEWL
ncbi:Tripartite tricarboxylate transporter TctB family protein [Consotaella salsifontis]|uniref:Tripartite tricarboxylate transporter TctB family protein n=2 Tax=Consotaella salsifontis TaxID=1365950 RepID=A0A1T4LI99_9HYPH|nr:Tripartite tricarboxylate transporter TctB family protein [Consotaella salsifontis]